MVEIYGIYMYGLGYVLDYDKVLGDIMFRVHDRVRLMIVDKVNFMVSIVVRVEFTSWF